MKNKLKKYFELKLKNINKELEKSLDDYFKYLEKKEELQKELNILESNLETEKFLNPEWQNFKHNPLTFSRYEEILLMEIEISYKQKEISEINQSIVYSKIEIETKKKLVIDCKVDLHWLEID